MYFSKSILSFLSAVLLVSFKTIRGEELMNLFCLNELAAYEACAESNRDVCDAACDNVDSQEPDFTEKDLLAMMTSPETFWCDWWSRMFCNIRECCSPCNDLSNAYFTCLLRDSAEDGTCTFSCNGNSGGSGAVDGGSGGAGDDESDSGGADEDGSDTSSGGVVDGDSGGADESESDNGGTGEGNSDTGSGGADDGSSSASPTLSMMMGWIGAVMVLGHRMI